MNSTLLYFTNESIHEETLRSVFQNGFILFQYVIANLFFILFIRAYVSVLRAALEPIKPMILQKPTSTTSLLTHELEQSLEYYKLEERWLLFLLATEYYSKYFLGGFAIMTFIGAWVSSPLRLLLWWWNTIIGFGPFLLYYDINYKSRVLGADVMLLQVLYFGVQTFFVGRTILQVIVTYVFWSMIVLQRFEFPTGKKMVCMGMLVFLLGNFWKAETSCLTHYHD